jgi:hypothetical protein
MKSHVHGFGVFGLDDVGDNTHCHRVVDLDGHWLLWMFRFFQ